MDEKAKEPVVETKKETSKPEPKAEQPKPEPKPEESKPEPKVEPPKEKPKAEPKPETKQEGSKPEPKTEPPKELPKAAPKAVQKQPEKVKDVAAVIKDTDLDLTAELEANIDVKKEDEEKKTPAIKEVKEPAKTVVIEAVVPTSIKPTEGETKTVAGIAPPGSQPAPDIKPSELKSVEQKTTTVAGITPDIKKAEDVPAVKPEPLGKVEAKTITVAGIKPGQNVPDLAPQAMKPTAGQVQTVAGIPPPGAAPVEEVKPKAMEAPEAKTMKVAGIAPGASKVAMEQAKQIAGAAQAKIQAKEPQTQTPPTSLQNVTAKTTTVAGIPPGTPATQNPKAASVSAPQKPVEQPPKPSEPVKPAEIRKRPPQQQQPIKKKQFEPTPDEFYDNLFYFSGMGTVVGSALSKGVYVPKRSTNTALDAEFIEKYEEQKDEEIAMGLRVVKRARNEAEDLAEEIRKLQSLLSGLPTFGTEVSHARPTMPRAQPGVFAPPPQPRKTNLPGLDLIAKKIEAVANDIPAAPRPPPQPLARPPPPLEPIKSAFTPVAAQAPPPPRPQAPPHPPVEHRVPPITTSGTSNVGVFKGALTNGPASHQSWQDKYAGKNVTDAQAPKPFSSGGDIPSGFKPWELSRLRGLEARGYEFRHEAPISGADHSDDFYHGGSHMNDQEGQATDDDIASYAPFLVSNKSLKVDRVTMLHHDAVSSDTFRPPTHLIASPPPVLPYCDL